MRLHSVWIVCLVTFSLIATSLAGVVGLSKNLRSNYKLAWRAFGPHKGVIKSISNVKPLVIDHLCIDLNQIIHSCIRGSKRAPSISVRMFAKLDTLLTKAPPRKSLVFAVDGAAPYAKVQTQRLRRKLEPDASLITPGTEYMNSMESVLLCYAIQRAKRFNLQDVAVFISDSTCPGEGELKLIDWIRCHMPARCLDNDPQTGLSASSLSDGHSILTTDTVAICGSDADILVQGLAQQSKCPNIHVIQAGMDSADAVCNITALLEGIATQPIVPQRRQNLTWLKENNQSLSMYRAERKRAKVLDASQIPSSVRSDLVIRFCLAGNDYLPKLRGVPLLIDLNSTHLKQLPLNQRHIVDTANKTFNFVGLWALMREADAATGEVLALPVIIPNVVDALNEEERITRASKIKTIKQVASSAVQLGEWNWTTTLVPANTVIRSYIHPESGKVQYFLPPPVNYTLDTNHTIYHLSESLAYTAEHNLSVFKNNLAWVCSLQHQGHTYTSLRLRHIKPSARRHLADMVLQDWRQDAHEALRVKRNTALEVLERMRVIAAEEAGVRRRELGFNITFQVPALVEDRAAPKETTKRSTNNDDEGFAADVNVDISDINCVAEDHNEMLLNTGTMPRRSYLQYLRDSDIEHYLRGLLWVEHMYTQGRCSDLGYTYNTPLPAISALAVQAYIERRALEHWYLEQPDYPNVTAKVPPIVDVIRSQQAALARDVFLPESSARPLTADAAAVCVTPEEGAAYLPLSLRETRKEVDAQLSALVTHNTSEIFCSTYEEVIASIDKSFAAHRSRTANAPVPSANSTEPGVKPKDIWSPGVKDVQKHRASANPFGTLSSAQMPAVYNTWTVLANKKLLHSRGYRGLYKHKSLNLPLPITFATFNLGAGASVFRLQNQNTAEPENGVHESNDPEPPHRKVRTWKPNKDVQKQKKKGYKVKQKSNTNVGAVNQGTTTQMESIEGPCIIHQHMLSRPFRTPTRSSASQDKECEQSTVGPTKEDNMGIIHQDMLRKPNL